MSLVHPLVTIEQTATAQQKAPEALKSGHINYGVVLVEMYATEDEGETKVKQLDNMAKSITTSEFSDAIKSAKTIADNMDKANGFVKAPGAKGQAAYGPKRQLLNSRMSEAKRIFGVFKQAPDVLKEKGYWLAVQTARQWLSDNARTWDGNHAETAEDKATRKERELRTAAFATIMGATPQKEGETMAQYQERIAADVESKINADKAEVFEKRVETLVQSLLKQFGDEPAVLEEACNRILILKATSTEESTEESKSE